jgi:hypothetical protein
VKRPFGEGLTFGQRGSAKGAELGGTEPTPFRAGPEESGTYLELDQDCPTCLSWSGEVVKR